MAHAKSLSFVIPEATPEGRRYPGPMNTEQEDQPDALTQEAQALCSWVPALAALGRNDKWRGLSAPLPALPPLARDSLSFVIPEATPEGRRYPGPMNTEQEDQADALTQETQALCSWVPALAALGRDDNGEGGSAASCPRPSNPAYTPPTALLRRDRVATGTMWEGRAAPVVRFGRFRPAEPRGSRYVRPTGMTGLPLVETALRVGCSPLASAGTRRPHAGEWKSEIIKRRAGRLRGATITYCEALLRRPAPSSRREEVTELFDNLGLARASGENWRVPCGIPARTGFAPRPLALGAT